jgi:hypothetical protein
MGFLNDAISIGTLGLVDGEDLFGDQGEGAARAQGAENAASRAFIERMSDEAKAAALHLFQGGQQARQRGSQSALDVLGGALPQQLQAFQQGNVGAQEALLGGQTDFRNTIMGLPQGPQFQPRTIDINTGFLPSSLPIQQSGGGGLSNIIAALGGAAQQPAQQPHPQVGGLNTPWGGMAGALRGRMPRF